MIFENTVLFLFLGMVLLCFLWIIQLLKILLRLLLQIKEILRSHQIPIENGRKIQEIFQIHNYLQLLKENFEKKREDPFPIPLNEEEIKAEFYHDLRSPLSALNLILEELDPLPENIRSIIVNSVKSLNNLSQRNIKQNFF